MNSAALNTSSVLQPVVQVEDLRVHYGERLILDGINLNVNPGEVLVVMGGSGSGKSTFLRTMLGLKAPSSGRVSLLGTDLQTANAKEALRLRQQMGVAFQGGALLSSMTVGENIRLPLTQHTRLDQNTMDIMTRLKLELVNLAGFENMMPAELSGGMLKRAAFARAVIMDPKLLFFDEPSAGLDPVTSAELDELILRLRDVMNTSIIVVTHELESAFKIADRIAVLGEGKMLLTGTVDEVRNSENEAIQNLLNRRPSQKPMDAEAYLQRLTGSGS